MTSVVIADDHPLLRGGLRRVLEEKGFAVLGEAGDGYEVVSVVEATRPEVVIMDISLPGRDGIAAARVISDARPEVGIVFLSMFDDEATIAASAAAGGRAFVVKDCSVATLTDALQRVAEKADLLCAYRGRPRGEGPPAPSLTKRELEVLQLVADGASTREMADTLYVSAKTLKNHLASIYDKLGARDRTQAVLLGIQHRLVTLRRASAEVQGTSPK